MWWEVLHGGGLGSHICGRYPTLSGGVWTVVAAGAGQKRPDMRVCACACACVAWGGEVLPVTIIDVL